MQTSQPAAGQQNALAYTADGYRCPLGDLPHQLGFNGELPDPLTGHYLLGNGYRAFNPVLMRFNSPDNLSPFGKGGVNAYAYCAGNPINWADPTGHTPILFKKALRRLNLMRPKAIETKAAARNIKFLDTHIVSFEETIGRRERLTLYGHGSRHIENNYHPMSSNQKLMTPDHVHHNAIMQGIDFGAYDDIRVLMCRSAAGGPQSFIAEFSEIINKPVSGYTLPVFARPSPQELAHSIRRSSSTVYKQGVSVYKRNPFLPDTDQHADFTYEKITLQSTRL